jgi:hypothetical protein
MRAPESRGRFGSNMSKGIFDRIDATVIYVR